MQTAPREREKIRYCSSGMQDARDSDDDLFSESNSAESRDSSAARLVQSTGPFTDVRPAPPFGYFDNLDYRHAKCNERPTTSLCVFLWGTPYC